MEMQGMIRTAFHEKMDHFDFMHLFFNSEKKCFHNISQDDILTMDMIEEIIEDNGVMHKPEGGGMIFGLHTVRIYDVDGKWIMYYRKKYFSIHTKTRYDDAEGIIIFKTISDRVKQNLASHVSYDGRMNCWAF